MDVLTIQWGWIGGYRRTTPTPPTPSPSGIGAISDVFYTPFPEDDEEGVAIVLLGLLEDDY